MSGTTNAQKRFAGRDLHEFGDKKSQDWLQRQPKAIPCTVVAIVGNHVKVKMNVNSAPFTLPQVTVPQSQSAYVREPTQVGDEGFLIVGDYYMGGVSGLGGGVADLTPRGNLTTGVFQPITRSSFPAMVDPNKAQVNGPAGVVIQDDAGMTVVTLTTTSYKIQDAAGNVVMLEASKIYVKPAPGMFIYLGGDGVVGSYDFVATASGPSINTKARFA